MDGIGTLAITLIGSAFGTVGALQIAILVCVGRLINSNQKMHSKLDNHIEDHLAMAADD